MGRWRKVAWWVVGLGGGCAAGLVAMNLWVTATASDAVFDRVDDVPPKHVAIVLGARVWPDGTPSPALSDRLAAALALYRAGRVRRVLVSGDHGAPAYDEPHAMRAWLVARGVPSDDVFMDHAGFRTLDTMQRAKKVFGVRDAVVCTHAFHQARAVFLARRAGIDAVGLVADRYGDPNAAFNAMREFMARGRAFVESYVLGTDATVLGPAVPIDGAAAASHDATTPL